MKELNHQEIQQASGGFTFMPFIIGSLINLITYTAVKKYKHEEITAQGMCVSAATGALTGGLGTACAGAAGGGLIGNAVWRPGFVAINAAGQGIAQEK